MGVREEAKELLQTVKSLEFTIQDKWQLMMIRDIKYKVITLYKSTENQDWIDSMNLFHSIDEELE